MTVGTVRKFFFYDLEDFLSIFETKDIYFFLPGPQLSFSASSHQNRIGKNCLLGPDAQFLVPVWEDEVDYGIGLSTLPVRD